ncbi:Dynein intermediate chain 2, ciliary [Clonorchis sinensis]|uniref:Dynein intermediate chain 2, ciliary n=1 Tax=Clonorchis sinensis TaxID=79923 RepID=A0A8T1MP31_CLOSI|nr:Dynein intermediate chain 2, ciliary [Clonorchis sinensis]
MKLDLKKKRKSQADGEDAEVVFREELDEFGLRSVIKPDDQLQLTEQELKEEVTRVLTATNPHAPQNIVRFNFKDCQYRQISQVDQASVHFWHEGHMLLKDSDEGRRQMARDGTLPTAGSVEEDANKEGAPVETAEGMQPKKLTNQFNFCERSTQTYNNPHRERGNMTEPPPRATFSANVTQWIIYDDYEADHQKLQEKTKEKKVAGGPKYEGKQKKKSSHADTLNDDLSRFAQPIKILERMINQNTHDEVAQDFKYYEDPSDEYRDQNGTLLPLWNFTFEKARKLAVTALCWSPRYNDLFAVGHGSYDFMKQSNGLICFYTMKNPEYPEYIFETDSGVLSLDLHPGLPHMLCVGFYDGSVGVYNINQHKSGPLYMSTAKTGKHTDPVWEVRWQPNDLDANLNFFSVSADGRVTSWTLVKEGVGSMHECPNDMGQFDALVLKMVTSSGDSSEPSQLITLDCGTAFDFHRTLPHLFLVATEEGMVYKCSKAYSSQYLGSYEAHHMSVYRVAWNHFHPDIFITCSADWTVKIWDHNKKDPVFMYDLGSPVGDVAWAPYSSTVFAAVTADGRVHVYDLSVNKYEPLCNQLVTAKKKTKLTHLAFNPKYSIIIVGDDRGQVTSLKLSPNLRKKPKEKKGLDQPKGPEMEVRKLEKILSLVG